MTVAIAPNWNVANGSLVEMSTYFGLEPFTDRVPLGDTKTVLLSGRSRVDGEQVITMRLSGLLRSSLSSYITAVHGSWTPSTTSVKCTLRATDLGGTEKRYNVYADFPLQGTDYEVVNHDEYRDLVITFRIIAIST